MRSSVQDCYFFWIGIKVPLIITLCLYHAGALDTLFMPEGGGLVSGAAPACVGLWVALRGAQVELKWRSETAGSWRRL